MQMTGIGLKAAHAHERDGNIHAAIEANLSLIQKYPKGGLAKIAESNILRLLRKLDSDCKKHALRRISEIHSSALLDANDIEVKQFKPFVSVVVPCYNCEDFLDQTVDSLKRQTYDHFEVILVDDFSKDRTSKICKKISQEDKRFRFYQHRANGGLAASRNSGTRLAKGDYICYLDSDDLMSPESLAQRVSLLAKYSTFNSIAGVYDQSITIPHDFNGEIEAKKTKNTRFYVDFITAFGDCPFNANQPMVGRDVIISMGGFPEQYLQAEDWRLWSKILRSGYVFLPVNRVGSGYRQTLNSMIRRAPLTHVEKSHGNFFRAFINIAEEQDPLEIRYENSFYANAYFTDSVGVYAGKQKFLPRVFNFVGIEYGRVETTGRALKSIEITDYLLRIEPDFTAIFSGYSFENVFNWILNGYKRYYGVSQVEDVKAKEIKNFTELTLNGLSPSWSSIRPEGTSIAVPDRVISKNDISCIDLLFMPHKYYHTYSFSLLLAELDKRGLSYKFLDMSVPYRDEGARVKELDNHFLSYNEFVFSRFTPRSIVCMNDWDTVVKPVVRKANTEGIPSIGIVEGVQDYLDVDTGRKRNPYREVSSVFLPGDFDRRYFEGTNQNLYSIGVQRLEGLEKIKEIRSQRMSSDNHPSMVVLNVNFSYNVMTDRRAQWIADVSTACKLADLDLVISQHPQDDADLSAYNVSKEPLYELLTKAKYFISRFSGAMLEALAIGCPVIYYNGHREKIDKFFDPLGAYELVNNKNELISLLQKDVVFDRNADAFLRHHACYGSGSIVVRTVDTLERIIHGAPRNTEKYARFKQLLMS